MTNDYRSLIIESFRMKNIKCVLLVDDAYDKISTDGQEDSFLDHLRKETIKDIVKSGKFSSETRHDSIINSIVKKEHETSDLDDYASELYEYYLKTGDSELDFLGKFSTLKEKQESLKPLYQLLHACGNNIIIKTAGEDNAVDEYIKSNPDIVFMDYWVDPPVQPIDENEFKIALKTQKSIKLLLDMFKNEKENSPFIILMSSQDIEDKVEPYIEQLENNIFAVRIGKIQKDWIYYSGENIVVSPEAGQVLLDSLIGAEFAKNLENSLKVWKIGLEDAIEELKDKLGKLDINDFAYLIKHRLISEGVDFSDYMEWFLGETLRTIIDNKVNWKDEAFGNLDNHKLDQNIIRSHPRPNRTIAELYRNVRISLSSNHRRKRFGLGDLFLSKDKKSIRMVVTPDCDLVPRGNKAPRAIQLTTVGGEIINMNEKEATAEDLIIIDENDSDEPKTIKWNKKDVMTHIVGNINMIKVYNQMYGYEGTLRPIYAQHVQKIVLSDFARVGLEVPPAIYNVYNVAVFIRPKKGDMQELADLPNQEVTIIVGREGEQNPHIVIFDKLFVHYLVAKLKDIEKNKSIIQCEEDVIELKKFIKNNKFIEKMSSGIDINDMKYGIKIVEKSNRSSWMQFKIDYSELVKETT